MRAAGVWMPAFAGMTIRRLQQGAPAPREV